MCKFLISPYSPNSSCRSSSLASSCTFVTRMIQPSMERTATAPVEVRISEVVGRAFLGLSSAGGSMSISVEAIAEGDLRRGKGVGGAIWGG